MSIDYKKLELKLRRIVEKRLSEGWKLERYMYVNDRDGECCAIGSMCVEYGVRSGEQVSRITGIDFGVIRSISNGFDNAPRLECSDDHEAFEIGARIHRIYCDDNGVVE